MSNSRSRSTPQVRVQSVPDGDVLTKQSFAADADVNSIVRRHLSAPGSKISQLGAGSGRQPIFGDFTSIDYQEMLNTVTDIDNVFRRLPARVRNRFSNDPYQVIRFCEDPANAKEAVKLGLIEVPPGYSVTESGELYPTPEPGPSIPSVDQNQVDLFKADPESNPRKS